MAEKILAKIDRAIITEERAVLIFARHIESILSWGGLDDWERTEIQRVLAKLRDESQQHKEQLQKLRTMVIQRESRNV